MPPQNWGTGGYFQIGVYQMSKDQILVRPAVLEPFVADLFAATGMTEEDAVFQAKALVDTNLWGVDSHGVLRVPVYIERLRKRAVNPRPQNRVVTDRADARS